MRWWLRTLAAGGAVGLGTGLIVGGTLGRIFMRLLFLTRKDTLGLETAMGATIGDVTAGGTLFIGIFGAAIGLVLGVAYVCVRGLMPSRLWWRETLFVVGASALTLGAIVRANRDDFLILPITTSLVLILSSVALAAAPLPYLVERIAPDRQRHPSRLAHAIVGLGLAAAGAYATTGIVDTYNTG